MDGTRVVQRFVVLFFNELSTRQIEIAGIASTANGLWMSQIGRNLTDSVDGLLKGKRFLIHDRDPLFTAEFLELLGETGVASVRIPPRSPNLNAHAERFVRIKESCLERLILFGEASVRRATAQFVEHYHCERNHQGLDNRLIRPQKLDGVTQGEVARRERLGGLLNYLLPDRGGSARPGTGNRRIAHRVLVASHNSSEFVTRTVHGKLSAAVAWNPATAAELKCVFA